MIKQEKLLNGFLSRSKDITCNELIRHLRAFGYKELQGYGSRVVFRNIEIEHNIKLYKPHPGNIMKLYQIDLIIDELKSNGLL